MNLSCPRCAETKYIGRVKKGKSVAKVICRNCQKVFSVKHKDYDPNLIPLIKDAPKPAKPWQSPERLIKVEEQKGTLPPCEEQIDGGTSQSTASQSSPHTGWDLLVSSLLCVVVMVAMVVTGDLRSLLALSLLVFQLDAFSQLLTSISGVFGAGKDWITRRGDMKKLAIGREELKISNEQIEVKRAELDAEIGSIRELKVSTKREIEGLAAILKVDDIRLMYKEDSEKTHSFVMGLLDEFRITMKEARTGLEEIRALKETLKKEA